MNSARRVLVVEDSEADQVLIRRVLERTRQRFEASFVRRLTDAVQAVGSNDFDVILLDLALPDSDRNHTLPAMRSAAPAIPIVVVTGSADERYGLDAVEQGAQDYVLKKDVPVEPVLERCIRYAIARHGAEVDLLKAREQLLKSQKLESIGRLAGGVAHDFNNILTAIFSFGQFVLAELDPASGAAQDMGELLSAARRAERLTSQLLAFSRRRTIEPRVVDLNEVVAEVEPMLRRLVGEHIDMQVHVCERPVPTVVDPTAFEQVLLNLVVNARDAMASGGALTIETGDATLSEADVLHRGGEAAAGDYVYLTVSDSGVGMSREVQERIFEPFFSTKSGSHGTGLGLSTCYGIVKQAGGFISVYSELGVGTTFKVYFPRSDRDANPLPDRAPVGKQTGDESILVVEDDVAVRSSTVRILRGLGYEVLEAASGNEALELVAGQRVDLLVTDVVMPQMNGKRLAWKLGRRLPSLRVLFMSGHTANVIVHHGVLDRNFALMHKPFTPLDLARKVREVLDSDLCLASRLGLSTVLLATPDETLIDGCARELHGRMLVVARTRDLALMALAEEELDAIVIDPRMPGLTLGELHSRIEMRDPTLAAHVLTLTQFGPRAIADELDRVLGPANTNRRD